jgi:universal stress protein A
MPYSNIIAAVDFSAASRTVLERAVEIAERDGARLTLIHVYEYFPPLDIADTPLGSVSWGVNEQELVELHRQQLQTVAAELASPPILNKLLTGNPKDEIVGYAREQASDLIVIGSHGRHGIGLLLGSTANAVLHHAPCDVLAVRIHEAD